MWLVHPLFLGDNHTGNRMRAKLGFAQAYFSSLLGGSDPFCTILPSPFLVILRQWVLYESPLDGFGGCGCEPDL